MTGRAVGRRLDRRRADGDDTTTRGRNRGRSVAARALDQLRLIAVALLLVGAVGYRPAPGALIDRQLVMPLAGAAVVVLLLVSLLASRAGLSEGRRRSRLALLGTVVDTVVVLAVVQLAGLPPRSFALVLLMLPLLEASLWFGLLGLSALWTGSAVTLGVLLIALPGSVPKDAVSTLVVAMPTLLLATIPVAMLAEHLVAQVGRLGTARETADDRARLLGDLSAITADIFPLDADAVLAQLVDGATRLGAVSAVVLDPAAGRHASPVLVTAGDGEQAAALPAAAQPDAPADGAGDADAEQPALLRRELIVPGSAPLIFVAAVTGSSEEVARRIEALDLLVAQAAVALANSVLVAQLEQLKQTFQDQATRDQLTGLLNRRGLVSLAQQLPGRLGILFCDLDGFKGVNDTFGHAAGDELLVQVARRLERQVRAGTLLGRMGGDEFVLVVPDADDDLASMARRIEIDLGRPFLLDAGMARIGGSVGVARSWEENCDLERLLHQADHLMYQVKRTRKAQRLSDDTSPMVPAA